MNAGEDHCDLGAGRVRSLGGFEARVVPLALDQHVARPCKFAEERAPPLRTENPMGRAKAAQLDAVIQGCPGAGCANHHLAGFEVGKDLKLGHGLFSAARIQQIVPEGNQALLVLPGEGFGLPDRGVEPFALDPQAGLGSARFSLGDGAGGARGLFSARQSKREAAKQRQRRISRLARMSTPGSRAQAG